MNMMISFSCLPTATTAVKIILLQIIVATTFILFPLTTAVNYNGTCDNVQPPWTDLTLEKGQFNYSVFYTTLYQNEDCSGEYWGTGIHHLDSACAPSPDNNGKICFRCINGTLSASLFDFLENIPDNDMNATNSTSEAAYLSQANATAYINCADGCGYTCYKLDQFSIRVGWHSSSQPLCEDDAPEVCPDVAPPAPAPAPAPTTTSSSFSALFGFLNILLTSLNVGLVVSATCLL